MEKMNLETMEQIVQGIEKKLMKNGNTKISDRDARIILLLDKTTRLEKAIKHHTSEILSLSDYEDIKEETNKMNQIVNELTEQIKILENKIYN